MSGPTLAASDPAALETIGLSIRFGGHVAVDNVSCAFHRGTLTAIVGPNGAGKTTYFNLVSGQLRASAGRIRLAGQDITGLSASARARAGVARAFQLTNLFPHLTVLENVRLAVQARAGIMFDLLRMASRNRALRDKAFDTLATVGLESRADLPTAALSHGDQRKLEVAILLSMEPEIFMFDEPTAGMNVDEVPVIIDLIDRLRQARTKTVVLVEHKVDVVRRLADRVVVLHNGRLVADGEPGAVMASPIVQEAYLGVRRRPAETAPHG